MDSKKPSINARLSDLIAEMVDLGIKYTDARDEFEKLFIKEVLNHNGYNKEEAADKLGIHRNTLYYKLRKLKLNK